MPVHFEFGQHSKAAYAAKQLARHLESEHPPEHVVLEYSAPHSTVLMATNAHVQVPWPFSEDQFVNATRTAWNDFDEKANPVRRGDSRHLPLSEASTRGYLTERLHLLAEANRPTVRVAIHHEPFSEPLARAYYRAWKEQQVVPLGRTLNDARKALAPGMEKEAKADAQRDHNLLDFLETLARAHPDQKIVCAMGMGHAHLGEMLARRGVPVTSRTSSHVDWLKQEEYQVDEMRRLHGFPSLLNDAQRENGATRSVLRRVLYRIPEVAPLAFSLPEELSDAQMTDLQAHLETPSVKPLERRTLEWLVAHHL